LHRRDATRPTHGGADRAPSALAPRTLSSRYGVVTRVRGLYREGAYERHSVTEVFDATPCASCLGASSFFRKSAIRIRGIANFLSCMAPPASSRPLLVGPWQRHFVTKNLSSRHVFPNF